MVKRSLILVGGLGGSNIGESFFRAAQQLGLCPIFLDHRGASSSFRWMNSFYRHFADKRLPHLDQFSKKVLRACEENRPSVLLTTGLSPIRDKELAKIRKMGTRCFNYLTDDPWNAVHRCGWFMESLKIYDNVFSVRQANMEDVKALQGPKVLYLPFAYDPELFYPENLSSDLSISYRSDIIFVGGADRDRVPFINKLVKAGLEVKLYGSYWERFKATKSITLGQADTETIRRSTCEAKIALCLVRRANRDDNCMRSFEIPAMRTCMLAEDTNGHREIFGENGTAVLYFKTPEEMMDQVRFLLTCDHERKRLATAAYDVIRQGKHTYKDRLEKILQEG